MSVSIKVNTRPIRFAFLVDPNDSEQVGEAIRLSSTLWGGVYFPIIELHKKIPATWKESLSERLSARKVILGHIDAFDPDFLVQLSEGIPKYIRDLGIRTIKSTDIWGDFNGRDGPCPSLGIGLFEVLDRIFEERFRPVHGKIVFPKLSEELYLFWAGVFGDVPSEFDPLLEERCFRRPEIDIFRTDFGNRRAVGVLAFQKFSPNATALFSIDLVRLYTRSFRSFLNEVPCIFFMDAVQVGDVVDFWNLRAMGKPVLPVPVQLKESPELKKAVARLLKRPERGGDPEGGTGIPASVQFLRARSRPMDEMREYTDSFEGVSSGFCDRYPRIWSSESLQDFPNRIYGEERIFISSATTREDEIRIRSVLPKFRCYGRQRPVCANEITIDSYMGADLVAEAFPRSSGENFLNALSGPTSFPEDWRGGRDGLVRLAENGFFMPQEVPFAEQVFFAWLRDLGWRPELSTPGVLAKRIHERLGGYVSRLQDEKLLWLLEHMNGGSVHLDKGPYGKNETGQEREMSVGKIKNRLKREESGRKSLYNYVIENGFFQLGARVKCPNCSRHSWFALESVRDSFACPKCLDTFDAVGNLDTISGNPWHYKTAGPFSIPNYADGAYGVLLSLHFFNGLKHGSMSLGITPVMSFKAESPEGKEMEIDFAAFWQSRVPKRKVELILGECKMYGKFEDADFKRMEYLAQAFEKQKPVLVFSTLRESLEAEEKERISCLAKTNPVMILTARELCSYPEAGLPQGKPGYHSGDYGLDLQNICDVTQRLYLGSGGSGKFET
ncbi:MAG: hypothetical protein OXK19_08530 [Candidatus Dadabacteria bacterium]|nr:hypothetical protein [Candidatus Dadabacteria bacterium]